MALMNVSNVTYQSNEYCKVSLYLDHKMALMNVSNVTYQSSEYCKARTDTDLRNDFSIR